MKRLFAGLMATTLLAALLCLPAAAAETASDKAEAAPAYHTPVRVWGTVTRLENGSLLLKNSNESAPNREIVIHIDQETRVIDAVTGLSMAAEDLKDGDTVYAWVGPAMMLSMPPQAHATVGVGNLPADAAAPQYYQVAEVKPQAMIAIEPPPPLTYVEFTATDGTEVKITDKAQLTPHLTRNMVSLESIRPGTELMIWRDGQGTVTKALLFAYQYRGYLAPYGEDRVSVNDIPLTTPVKTTKDGDVLVPLRAAAEVLGMEVHWDSAKGAVVSYGEAMIKPEPLESNVLFTAMPGGKILTTNSQGEEEELYGTCVIEQGVTYLSAEALAQALDLFQIKK